MGNTQTLKLKIIQDKKDAQNHLNRAEKEDFYLEECHDDKSNSIARRNLTYSPNSISISDINNATIFIESVSLPIKLVSELGEINIIQLMPTADGGMPHTRSNIICYPDISLLFSKTTLIHELWHIHQRTFQRYWIDIFKQIGWTSWNGVLPYKLENNRRYNPDTIDSPFWIFKDTWVPVPIFKDITHPTVNNVEVWFYNPHKEYHTRQIPELLSSYFTNLNNVAFEHPREITAYMLSEAEKFKSSIAYKDLINAIGYTATSNAKSNAKSNTTSNATNISNKKSVQ